MKPEEDPFAAFAAPREKPSAVEAWKRRRAEEAQQWRGLVGVGVWLVVGTLVGSSSAAALCDSWTVAGTLLGGVVVGMPLGLLVGWLLGFGSWGGRAFRGTRLVATSDAPVPLIWLGVCCGVGLVTGAALGSVTLPSLLLEPALANRADVPGPAGVCTGAAVALVLAWLRGRGRA